MRRLGARGERGVSVQSTGGERKRLVVDVGLVPSARDGPDRVGEDQRERNVAELGVEERLCRLVRSGNGTDAVETAERTRRRRAERAVAVVDEYGVVVGKVGHVSILELPGGRSCSARSSRSSRILPTSTVRSDRGLATQGRTYPAASSTS